MQKMPRDFILLNLCTTNDDMMYGSWDMGRDRQNFWSFWAIFSFTPHYQLKNQNFEKIKKKTGDIIILHLCTTNDNNMMYGWDTDHEEHNFLSFWTIFCPFTP